MHVSSFSLMTVVDDSDPVLGELVEVAAAPEGLPACLPQVVDPRKRRGVRHPVTGMVALALAATVVRGVLRSLLVDVVEPDLTPPHHCVGTAPGPHCHFR
jgi:hypothetical protein